MSFARRVMKEAKKTGARIVLPEAHDERILRAASTLARRKIVTPLLIGRRETINEHARKHHINLKGVIIINPEEEEYAKKLSTLKKITLREAREEVKNPLIRGALMVREGRADGLVSGATHPTSETIKAGIHIIRVRKGLRTASSLFFMERGKEALIFADCGFNIKPTSDQLADITMETARTAQAFGITPRVALLSFSTKGSAHHEEVTKVQEALKKIKRRRPGFTVDGELQFDAAYVPEVQRRKAPNSPLQGKANTYIFPDLNSGNISYKIAERLGGMKAYGPILQGFTKPINDLSRGCSAEDIIVVAAITALQAKNI